MAIERFEGPFHQSDIKHYQRCPRSFYYGRVMELDQEKISLANLGGRAGHTALEYAHKNNVWSPDTLYQVFLDDLEAEKFRALDKGLEINGAIDLDNYRQILAEYAAKTWNREARVILMEGSFYFEIKPASTVYKFEGRIDQLVENETDLLRAEFPGQFGEVTKPTVILHRDTKFGQRRQCSPFELALDVQFDIYAYAMKHGLFWSQGNGVGNEGEPVCLDLIPDFHVKYHVVDHLPYKDDKGTYLKDENGNYVSCDIVPEPCLVGKTQKPCAGKRSWCTKQSRGPGMYFTTRTEKRLEGIPRELMRTCQAVRQSIYPRNLGDLCFNYCQFKSVCEQEVMQELEAA